MKQTLFSILRVSRLSFGSTILGLGDVYLICVTMSTMKHHDGRWCWPSESVSEKQFELTLAVQLELQHLLPLLTFNISGTFHGRDLPICWAEAMRAAMVSFSCPALNDGWWHRTSSQPYSILKWVSELVPHWGKVYAHPLLADHSKCEWKQS